MECTSRTNHHPVVGASPKSPGELTNRGVHSVGTSDFMANTSWNSSHYRSRLPQSQRHTQIALRDHYRISRTPAPPGMLPSHTLLNHTSHQDLGGSCCGSCSHQVSTPMS